MIESRDAITRHFGEEVRMRWILVAVAAVACTTPNEDAALPECYAPEHVCSVPGRCNVETDYAGTVPLRVSVEDNSMPDPNAPGMFRTFRDDRILFPSTGHLMELSSDAGFLRCWPSGGVAQRFDVDPKTGEDSPVLCWTVDGAPTECPAACPEPSNACPPWRWQPTVDAELLPYEYTHTERSTR